MKYDATSEKLKQMWSDGKAKEEYTFGFSSSDTDLSTALIITDEIIGFICEDNSFGQVHYEVFTNKKDALSAWDYRVTQWMQQFHPEAYYA